MRCFTLLLASALFIPFCRVAEAQVTDVVTDIAVGQATDRIEEVEKQVNEDVRAQEASKSILSSIYAAAEYLSFPAFHWVAFALMSAGFVSFLGQLVLGKLIMLAKLRFNLFEILSDLLGLLISTIGLIMVTQAATENSTFPQSPFMVLSAAAVGAVFGVIFYIRGQTQELREMRAR